MKDQKQTRQETEHISNHDIENIVVRLLSSLDEGISSCSSLRKTTLSHDAGGKMQLVYLVYPLYLIHLSFLENLLHLFEQES